MSASPPDLTPIRVPASLLPLTRSLSQLWTPPSRLPLSDWSEKNIVLSSEYSARASRLHLYGWQREPLDAFTDPAVSEVVMCTAVQLIKCLDIRTPVPTVSGWKLLGVIEKGDRIFDDKGRPCIVTAVSPIYHERPCFKITFDEGSEFISDGGHRWEVTDRRQKGAKRIVTTEEMFNDLHNDVPFHGNETAKRYRIACPSALDLPDAVLPIDPYVLGCWLGDGTTTDSSITADIRDGVIDELRATGTEVRIVSADRRWPHVVSVKVGGSIRRGCPSHETMQGRLTSLGILGDKRIPRMYLRSSREQRLALLQGILDTDGCALSENSVGVVLSITLKPLAKDCMELMNSLGMKPRWKEIRSVCNGRDYGPCYRLYVSAYKEDRPFRLSRKLDRLKSRLGSNSQFGKSRARSIVSIERTDSVPVRCLAVDSLSHLFLAGRSMIPTHNTLLIQCAIAYVAVEDPGPILLLEPKEDSCLHFSKRRLAPMIRDCDCLRSIMSGSLHSSSGSTLLSKDFPGGNLLIVSANTPVDVAQHTIRYVFCDEPDKYPKSAGKEGDPMNLAWARSITFGSRRKRILCCSPTIAGQSRIGTAYQGSDQRKPWVPCWKCGQYQILKFFPDSGGSGGVRWDSSIARERQPETTYYECAYCGAHWTDNQRWTACNKTEWRAEKPFAGIAGFWINHLYSPWRKLSDIVKDFLAVKDDREQYKTFVNTVLAQEWQEDGETPDAELLYNRREDYAYGESAVVPRRGLFLTAAVDVQDSPPRLEVEVVAWGRGRERWSISYQTLQLFAENGQPLPVTSPDLWHAELAKVLNRDYPHESGHTLPIMAMAIDTGSRPKPVYDFARRHPQLSYSAGSGLRVHAIRTVIPVKGNDDPIRIVSAVSKEDAIKKRQGVRIVSVGTHCVKQQIFDILKHVKPSRDGSPTPDCYHFPRYDMPYFDGLCSEIRVVDDKGKVKYVRRPGSDRNEPLDIAVMGRAAASIVGVDRFTESHWRQLERALDPATVLQRTTPMLQSTLSGVDVPASAPLTSPSHPLGAGEEGSRDASATPATPAPPLLARNAPPLTNPTRPPRLARPPRPTRGSFMS